MNHLDQLIGESVWDLYSDIAYILSEQGDINPKKPSIGQRIISPFSDAREKLRGYAKRKAHQRGTEPWWKGDERQKRGSRVAGAALGALALTMGAKGGIDFAADDITRKHHTRIAQPRTEPTPPPLTTPRPRVDVVGDRNWSQRLLNKGAAEARATESAAKSWKKKHDNSVTTK